MFSDRRTVIQGKEKYDMPYLEFKGDYGSEYEGKLIQPHEMVFSGQGLVDGMLERTEKAMNRMKTMQKDEKNRRDAIAAKEMTSKNKFEI